jgi:hypothetical protein
MGSRSAAPRYVAFSTIDDEPWEAGASAGELLERVRALASLGIGLTRFTEILDCGEEAGDVLDQGTPLAEARSRFPTVFRGDGVPGLVPVPLEETDP